MSGCFVTENDIKNWTATNKRRAEELLPLLVKKLILASSKPTNIDFPSGDSVAVGGWDGTLELDTGNYFIPSGKSGWEFGTNEAVKGKADEDYKKRSDNPAPFDASESSYVFVTSRLWTKRDDWVSEKQSDGKWKNVKGINASTLAEWLELCPAVHRWFAQLIGKREPSVKDITQAWDDFSHVTQKQLTTGFFLHEREKEASELSEFLKNGSGVFRIFSVSQAEAIGFILSVLQSNEVFDSKALVIITQQSWDFMMANNLPLILIPFGFQPANIGAATSKKHLVIKIEDQYAKSPDLVLERQQRIHRETAIQKLGFDESESSVLYQDTRGYLEPLLRHELLEPIDQISPEWIDKYDPEILFTALFASEWRDDNKNDQKIIETLSDQSYASVRKQLIDLSNESDPPIRIIRNNWQVISKLDFWFLIQFKISNALLERLQETIPSLFTDFDPSYDLSPDERYIANITGHIPKHSGILKNGIADTLALLATFGDDCSRHLRGVSVRFQVSYWLRKLFEENNSVRFWFSLGNATRSFAEAAPIEFVDAVIDASTGEDSELEKLFKAESDDGLGGGCYHCDLLWALESISWNETYLALVSGCLSRLAEVDNAETNRMNRPLNSLVDIYLGWINNTSATHDERIQILRHVLIPSYSEVSWSLMLKLLPGSFGSSTGVNKPKYCDWSINVDSDVTQEALISYIGLVVDLLLIEVDKDLARRILDLINSFDSYSDEQIDSVLSKLLTIDEDFLHEDEREKIINTLRETIAHHRGFPDADWSWKEALLLRLEGVYHKFEFSDDVRKNAFLFNSYEPDLIDYFDKTEYDYDERLELISSKRAEALEAVVGDDNQVKFTEFVDLVSEPSMIGRTAYLSAKPEIFEQFAFDWIDEESNRKEFSNSYLSSLAYDSLEKAKKILSDQPNWSTRRKIKFLQSFPINEETLDLVTILPLHDQEYYWEKFNNFYSADSTKIKLQVVENLNRFKRPYAAINLLGRVVSSVKNIDKVDPTLVTDLLKSGINKPSDLGKIEFDDIRYNILKCIEFIQNSDVVPDDDLVFIEWNFLELFKFNKQEPKTLFKTVSSDPVFFSQLISWVFKRKDGKEDPGENVSEESLQNRAKIAEELLRMLRVLPGQKDQSIDKNLLDNWVDKAREKLALIGRKEIGNSQIGQYLSRSQSGKDGFWPHESVRHVIEKYKSKSLETALSIGKTNLRGVTTRHPYSGGKQERELAQQYLEASEAMKFTFPRTSRLLLELSQYYENKAKRYDDDVELSGGV